MVRVGVGGYLPEFLAGCMMHISSLSSFTLMFPSRFQARAKRTKSQAGRGCKVVVILA